MGDLFKYMGAFSKYGKILLQLLSLVTSLQGDQAFDQTVEGNINVNGQSFDYALNLKGTPQVKKPKPPKA